MTWCTLNRQYVERAQILRRCAPQDENSGLICSACVMSLSGRFPVFSGVGRIRRWPGEN
jgi:hypothetical protein